jgi:RimJ/RimL family protein N-acetyltransferase
MSSINAKPTVKLQLSVVDFDIAKWRHYIAESERLGIRFYSLAELGDSEANRRRLYELNKECSADIPGRGAFYSYEEYQEKRIAADNFTPAGVILAVQGEEWIGMAAVSHRSGQDVAFNAMTGVLRSYRRRGIATSLKILSIQFAQSLGVSHIYTFHAAANLEAIAMNRRLGYIDRL